MLASFLATYPGLLRLSSVKKGEVCYKDRLRLQRLYSTERLIVALPGYCFGASHENRTQLPSCGTNRFSIQSASSDDCDIFCLECGHAIGTLGFLKERLAEEVLLRAAQSRTDTSLSAYFVSQKHISPLAADGGHEELSP